MFRRIVTVRNSAGKSVISSDGPSPREQAREHTPGFVSAPLWKTSAIALLLPDRQLTERTLAGMAEVDHVVRKTAAPVRFH